MRFIPKLITLGFDLSPHRARPRAVRSAPKGGGCALQSELARLRSTFTHGARPSTCLRPYAAPERSPATNELSALRAPRRHRCAQHVSVQHNDVVRALQRFGAGMSNPHAHAVQASSHPRPHTLQPSAPLVASARCAGQHFRRAFDVRTLFPSTLLAGARLLKPCTASRAAGAASHRADGAVRLHRGCAVAKCKGAAVPACNASLLPGCSRVASTCTCHVHMSPRTSRAAPTMGSRTSSSHPPHRHPHRPVKAPSPRRAARGGARQALGWLPMTTGAGAGFCCASRLSPCRARRHARRHARCRARAGQ